RTHRRSEVGYIPPDGPSHSERDSRASISGPPNSADRQHTLPGINSHTFIQEHGPPQHRQSISSHQTHRSGSIPHVEQSNQSLPPASAQTEPREPHPQCSQRPMSACTEMQTPHHYHPLPPRDEPHHHRTRPGSRDQAPHNA